MLRSSHLEPLQEAQDAALELFGSAMQRPERDRIVLRGKLREDDGSWTWSAIRKRDWATLVPGVYNELGVFEIENDNSK